MGNDYCKQCGITGEVFTAPDGRMVCANCLEFHKLYNLARVRGYTDEQITEDLLRAFRDMLNGSNDDEQES